MIYKKVGWQLSCLGLYGYSSKSLKTYKCTCLNNLQESGLGTILLNMPHLGIALNL